MGTRICVLNEGKLQQIDSPFNLYHNPHNIFVAGFIGSPSMNFFDATLKEDGDNLVVDVGAFTLQVPPSKADSFRSHVGMEVVCGIRPEDIDDSNYLPQGIVPANMTCNVEVVEQMGNEVIIYLENAGKNFIARTDPRTDATVGEPMEITINLDNMHLFDTNTEMSLSYESKTKGANVIA